MASNSRAACCRLEFMDERKSHRKMRYYTWLETCQKGDLNITRWLEWFLSCLGRAIDGAENSIDSVLRKSRVWDYVNRYSINARQRKVIHQLLEGFRSKLTTSKYASLAKCSNDTALRDIRELIEHKILSQNPEGGRNTGLSF